MQMGWRDALGQRGVMEGGRMLPGAAALARGMGQSLVHPRIWEWESSSSDKDSFVAEGKARADF